LHAPRNEICQHFPVCKDGRGTGRKYSKEIAELGGKLYEKQVSEHGTKVDPAGKAAAKERKRVKMGKIIASHWQDGKEDRKRVKAGKTGKFDTGKTTETRLTLGEMREQRMIRAEAAERRAKEACRRQDLIGARVRVECQGKEYFDGVVDSWDEGQREFKIVFDDGDELYSPINENSWDVQVLSKASKPPASNASGLGAGTGMGAGAGAGAQGRGNSTRRDEASMGERERWNEVLIEDSDSDVEIVSLKAARGRAGGGEGAESGELAFERGAKMSLSAPHIGAAVLYNKQTGLDLKAYMRIWLYRHA